MCMDWGGWVDYVGNQGGHGGGGDVVDEQECGEENYPGGSAGCQWVVGGDGHVAGGEHEAAVID